MKLLICSEESLDVSNSRCQEKLKQNKFEYGSVLAHAFLPVVFLGSVHTLPKNFENGISLWKRIKCFPSILHRRNLTTQQSPVIFGFVFEENWGREITWLSWRHSLVFKCYSLHTETQSRRFQIFLVEERFWKAAFSWRISVDGRPNRKKKDAFSHFFSVVWI